LGPAASGAFGGAAIWGAQASGEARNNAQKQRRKGGGIAAIGLANIEAVKPEEGTQLAIESEPAIDSGQGRPMALGVRPSASCRAADRRT
jgi:hypothetical protein